MSVVICLFGKNGFDRAAQGVAGAGRRWAEALGALWQVWILGGAIATTIDAAREIADGVVIGED